MDNMQTFGHKLESLRKELNIPGMSVAVLREQEVIFKRGFGYADVENRIPATEQTPYHIASLTKPFSAALIMQLVEAGQLDLDDAMAGILNDTNFTSQGVTRYANLCHAMKKYSKDESLGYAFLFQDYRGDTERITVKHHLTHTSQGVPGKAYRYNGFLFGLLTYVIEEVSGKRFTELLVERIIGPLKMDNTFPNQSKDRGQQILDSRAKPYKMDEEGDPALSEYPGGVSASAGMVSTVLDLGKFDAAMDRDMLVSKESKEAMFTPTISNSGQPLVYGMGWFVQEHYGTKLIWHYGWQPDSYSSLIVKIPERKSTLILLANSDGASAPFGLGDGDVLKSPFAAMFI